MNEVRNFKLNPIRTLLGQNKKKLNTIIMQSCPPPKNEIHYTGIVNPSKNAATFIGKTWNAIRESKECERKRCDRKREKGHKPQSCTI